jgi:hypothetical protein
MALIGEWSTCTICGGALDRPYTATSGVAFASNQRLWAYCDAPLHFDCLSTWADREEFSREYFVSSLARYWSGDGLARLCGYSYGDLMALGRQARLATVRRRPPNELWLTALRLLSKPSG